MSDVSGRSPAEPEERWPFGDSDGGPSTRPRVVDLDGVLIAVLEDTPAGERAKAWLAESGISERRLRLYTGEEIVAFDEAFKANRSLGERIVGAVVDDRDAMDLYVEYGGEGRSALWVLVPDRQDANRVVRLLSRETVLHIWYYGRDGVQTLRMG